MSFSWSPPTRGLLSRRRDADAIVGAIPCLVHEAWGGDGEQEGIHTFVLVQLRARLQESERRPRCLGLAEESYG